MNISPFWTTVISLIFLAAGAIALITMLVVRGRKEPPETECYSSAHRWSGWIFTILFLFMVLVMLARIEDSWEESSARIALHVALATGLILLLALKVTIPRFFPRLMKHLFPLGLSVYLLAFVLVLITAGYYIIWKYEEAPYFSHAELPEHLLDLDMGKQLFIDKCSICHLLENIMQTRSTASWEEVVNRMVELAEPRITPAEGVQILHYLNETHTPEVREEGTLLEKHCLPCHDNLSRIARQEHSRSGWREIILQMRQYGPKIIPADRVEPIVERLTAGQEPVPGSTMN